MVRRRLCFVCVCVCVCMCVLVLRVCLGCNSKSYQLRGFYYNLIYITSVVIVHYISFFGKIS